MILPSPISNSIQFNLLLEILNAKYKKFILIYYYQFVFQCKLNVCNILFKLNYLP